ncbi:MAG: porin family protein [Bacteroidia bacterium]
MRDFYRLTRVLLCSGFFLLMQGNITAQGFDAGLIIGFNTSQISGDDLGGFDRISPNAGIFVKRQLKDKFSLQLEMTYLGKGSKANIGPDDPATAYYLLRTHYIEIPILFQFQFSNKIIFEAGPSLGVYIGHKEEDINGEFVGVLKAREQFKRFDLSGNLGVIWKFNDKWALNVRGSNSILPVRNFDQQASFRLTRGQLNKSIMGRVFYTF